MFLSQLSDCLMTSSLPSCCRPAQVTCRLAGDEKLGFEGCVAALGKRSLESLLTYIILLLISFFSTT